jgi:hypothetical protein
VRILLDRLEAECIGIPSELDEFGFDSRLDLDRIGLVRPENTNPSPILAARSNAASLGPPNQMGICRFGRGKTPARFDPVVGLLVFDDRLCRQLADQGNLLLLPVAAAAEVSRHIETVVFHPVPADPGTQSKTAVREQVDVRGLFGEQGRLSLRQYDDPGYQFEPLGDAGEVGVR